MAKKNRKNGSKARLENIAPGEVLAAGIDVHKKSYSLAIYSQLRGEVIFESRVPADDLKVVELLAPLREHLRAVVYEAGPTGFSLARTLAAHDLPAQVVSAAHTPEGRGDQQKNDPFDARRLARFAALGLLRPVYIPSEQEQARRAVLRQREDVARQIRSIKAQIRSFLLFHGIAEPEKLGSWSKKALAALRGLSLSEDLRFVLDDLLHQLDYQMERRAAINKQLNRLEERPEMKAKVERLCQIPGIGQLTALHFLCELLAPERFSSCREVAQMLGLAPLVRSSGETRREMGRTEGGNKRLRSILVEAAWRWVGGDEAARARFERHKRKTGSAKKAITAMARHLGILMWKMTVSGEDYDSGRWEGAAA